MSISLRRQVIEEIQLVPEEKLASLFDFVHYFRLGTEVQAHESTGVLEFAGAWADMPEEVFDELLEDMAIRRQKAFLRRNDRELSPG